MHFLGSSPLHIFDQVTLEIAGNETAYSCLSTKTSRAKNSDSTEQINVPKAGKANEMLIEKSFINVGDEMANKRLCV